MTAPSAEEQLRTQVRAALTRAKISQAEACRQLDCSTKHMSEMLTGKQTLSLGWAERILALCGAHLVIVTSRSEDTPSRRDRVPLDHLNSDQYDELCADLDRYEEVVDELNGMNIELARRAGRALARAARRTT